jgi:hypothetical protein
VRCLCRAWHAGVLRHHSSTTWAQLGLLGQAQASLTAAGACRAAWRQGLAKPVCLTPVGRWVALRSRGSDTWMPRDHGTTSISEFPQPVKSCSWHMAISMLCLDICKPGLLQHQLRGQGLRVRPELTQSECSSSVGRRLVPTRWLAEMPGTSTVPVGTNLERQADQLVECLQLCCG